MTIVLRNSSDPKESPVEAKALESIISQHAKELSSPKSFIKSISQSLITKSSRHKFLVSVTTIEQKKPTTEDVSIRSTIGTIWDDETDGYFSFEVKEGAIYLVTVYWINVN